VKEASGWFGGFGSPNLVRPSGCQMAEARAGESQCTFGTRIRIFDLSSGKHFLKSFSPFQFLRESALDVVLFPTFRAVTFHCCPDRVARPCRSYGLHSRLVHLALVYRYIYLET
jgi:hypothetical protein